jgi:hypothetical protein
MDKDKGEATHNFEAFCKVFRENYALFDVKCNPLKTLDRFYINLEQKSRT